MNFQSEHTQGTVPKSGNRILPGSQKFFSCPLLTTTFSSKEDQFCQKTRSRRSGTSTKPSLWEARHRAMSRNWIYGS